MPEVPQPSELRGPVSLLSVAPDGEKVKFQKEAWSLGQQRVNLVILSEQTGAGGTGPALSTVATGAVSAGGQLSLKLPETVDAGLLSGALWTGERGWKDLLGEHCQGTKPELSDPAARWPGRRAARGPTGQRSAGRTGAGLHL